MSIKSSLSILNDFTCLGADCPDDCCHGWNLHIDTETLAKWRTNKNTALKTELLDSISIINENNRATEVVKQQRDGRCVFLSEQGLCTIQQRCGHDFLPETCRDYPRVNLENDVIQLYSAHLSCPGIIQILAKQHSNDNLFTEVSENAEHQNSLDSKDISTELGNSTLQVLAAKKYSLGLRFYFLASILQQLATNRESTSDDKRLAKICRISPNALDKKLTNIHNQFQNNKLKLNKKVSGLYWQFVFRFCRALSDNELKPRIEQSASHQALLKFNQADQQLSDKDYLKHYQIVRKIQSNTPKKITDQIDAILTPVMQVKFKNHGFPWFLYKNSLELTYLDCIVPYGQIKLILGLLYETEQKITEQDIITVIYKVEKTVAHNTLILEQLEYQPELLQIASYAGCWIGG